MASRTTQRQPAARAASWAALASIDSRELEVDHRLLFEASLRRFEGELGKLAKPVWIRTPHEVCQITLIGETGRDFKDFVPGWSQHACDVLGPRPDNSDPPAWRLALLAALAAEALRLPTIPDALYERFTKEVERHGTAANHQEHFALLEEEKSRLKHEKAKKKRTQKKGRTGGANGLGKSKNVQNELVRQACEWIAKRSKDAVSATNVGRLLSDEDRRKELERAALCCVDVSARFTKQLMNVIDVMVDDDGTLHFEFLEGEKVMKRRAVANAVKRWKEAQPG